MDLYKEMVFTSVSAADRRETFSLCHSLIIEIMHVCDLHFSQHSFSIPGVWRTRALATAWAQCCHRTAEQTAQAKK